MVAGYVDYTSEEVARFRAEFPDLVDLPDEVVVSLMTFQWWLFGERVRELGRQLRKTFPNR